MSLAAASRSAKRQGVVDKEAGGDMREIDVLEHPATGPYFYECDLEPTLSATRPPAGELEVVCSRILREGEAEALLRVRAMLADEMAAVSEWLPDVHGDVRLLRFLRKCKGDETAAVGWYREMLEWRAREGVDEVRRRIVEEGLEPKQFPRHAQLQALMPVTLWSERPRAHVDAVQVIYNGRWETRGLVKAIRAGKLTEKDFLRYWVFINEWLSLRIDALSRRHGCIAGVKLVCDMREADPIKQFSKTFFYMMGPWAAMSQDNYPMTSVDIYFVDAPQFFNLVWAIICPMLNEDTRSKIAFASSKDLSWLPHLGLDAMPAFTTDHRA